MDRRLISAISPGHAGEVSGDGMGGVPVEVGLSHVLPHGGAGVGVTHGVLHVPQGDAADESGRREGEPEAVMLTGGSMPMVWASRVRSLRLVTCVRRGC